MWSEETREEKRKDRKDDETEGKKTDQISFLKKRGKVSFLHNVSSLKCLRTKDLLSQVPTCVCVCAASCVKRGVLACGQEAAGGYLDLGGLPPAFCWRGSPRRRPRSETAA